MVKPGLSQEEIAALFNVGSPEPQSEAPAVQSAAPASSATEPRAAQFPSLEAGSATSADPISLGKLAEVEMELTVELGQSRRNLREILAMGPGSVMELDKHAGEAVDLLVNGRLVARGEVVVIGENYGVRITELVNPEGSQPR